LTTIRSEILPQSGASWIPVGVLAASQLASSHFCAWLRLMAILLVRLSHLLRANQEASHAKANKVSSGII
jgi:hypothetical protein